MSIEQFLPPDPEGMNNERADWAGAALRHFECTTGTDETGALADLLCNLLHWCDREGFSFDKELECARDSYAEETVQRGTAGAAYEAAAEKAARAAGFGTAYGNPWLISMGGAAGRDVEYFRTWAACCHENGIEVTP
jgi:hypothetical protein